VSRRQVSLALAAIFLLALGLRVLAWFLEPPHHPDEFFQYLEPAWRHLTGAGVETWEWRRGVRSWVLPGYHGAWMALLQRIGVRDGRVMARLLQAHWGVVSLTLVWAGWRGGRMLARRRAWWGRPLAEPANDPAAPPHGWQAGLLAALLCAAFPLLVRFSVHTLSELASLLCMVSALVLTGELAETPEGGRAAKTVGLGVLIGIGFALRIQHAPVALVIALWLLLARRPRQLGLVTVMAFVPVLCFGAIDWLTWGSPFASYVGYIRFNLFEGGADLFGKLPAFWYGQTLWHRLPVGFPVVGLLCLLALRQGWPFVASALGFAALLSTQAHKEERFAMLCWPLLLIPAAACVGTWLAARPTRAGAEPGQQIPRARLLTWLRRAAVAAIVGLLLADGALHARGNDFPLLSPLRFQAQAWVGRQRDLTGLVYDQPLYTGGYLWFSRPFPQLMYKPGLLANPLMSHVLAPRDSDTVREARRTGFTEVFSRGEIVVLQRVRPHP
jgi:hypothetical protein